VDAGNAARVNKETAAGKKQAMATGFLWPAPFEKARVANLVEASTVGVGSQYGGGQQGRHAGRGPKGYRRSDERIQEEFKDQLTQHGDIDVTEMMVKVTSGVVTPAGTVEDRNSGSGNGSNKQSESQMTSSSSSSKR
jgi:osmotically-inducible protein OsmY